jgi:hypothetical protein
MTCMVVGKTYIRIFRLPMPPHNILAKCEALATPLQKNVMEEYYDRKSKSPKETLYDRLNGRHVELSGLWRKHRCDRLN